MEYNWPALRSGATFHALVSALLLHEDPDVRVFDKGGSDGAIDALSSDRRTVMQFKYHGRAIASQARKDAKQELNKIIKYRIEGNKWYDKWKDVDTWILITNSPAGPDDDDKWEKNIVPLFRVQGLKAQCWGKSHLESRLADHPSIAKTFFGGSARTFLSLAEHREQLLDREVLKRAYEIQLKGRMAEKEAVRNFIGDPTARVQLVHGRGGIGKSRFLYEMAYELWKEKLVDAVHCGTPNLPSSSCWFADIVPDQQALVLLDEPTDKRFIEGLLAELRSRAKRWKVLIAVRTPRDPIVEALTDPRERLLAKPLKLEPLARPEGEELAKQLVAPLRLPDADRSRLVQWLVEFCDCTPIWMTIAVHLVESRGQVGDLPSDPFRVAQEYLKEIIDCTNSKIASPDQLRSLLPWLALYQPVNRQDESLLDFLAKRSGLKDALEFDEALEDLASRGVIRLFGLKRRVAEIRPDVMRDHVLIDWLSLKASDGSWKPSAAGTRLAAELAKIFEKQEDWPRLEHVIKVLGRIELLVESSVRFLDPLAEVTIKLAREATSSLDQNRALGVGRCLSFFRPMAAVELGRLFRKHQVPDGKISDPIYGELPIEHSRILDEVPAMLVKAARGSASKSEKEKESVLRELVAYIDREYQEHKGSYRPADGNSAEAVTENVIHGGYGFRSSFHEEATKLAESLLADMECGSGIPGRAGEVILRTVLTLKWTDTHPSTDGKAITMQHRALSATGQHADRLIAIIDRLWGVAASTTAEPGYQKLAWRLLTTFVADLSDLRQQDPTWSALLSRQLNRCQEAVEQSSMTLEMISSARPLWSWHSEFEKEDDLKEIACKCEDAYRAHPFVRDYVDLFGGALLSDDQASPLIDGLCESADSAVIERFFAGALEYTSHHPQDRQADLVFSFARQLGAKYGDTRAVRSFSLKWLSDDPIRGAFAVGASISNGRLHTLRLEDNAEERLRESLGELFAARDDEQFVQTLLRELYAEVNSAMSRFFRRPDLDILKMYQDQLLNLEPQICMSALASFLALDISWTMNLVKTKLEKTSRDDYANAVVSLWKTYYHSLLGRIKGCNPDPQIVDALLEILALSPDLGALHQAKYIICEICKRVPHKPISWLVEVIEKRVALYGPQRSLKQKRVPGKAVWVFPHHDDILLEAVAKIPDRVPTDEEKKSMRELISQTLEHKNLSVGAPGHLASLDPHGRVLPDAICSRLRNLNETGSAENLRDLAEYASAYPHASANWRTIAVEACRLLDTTNVTSCDSERNSVYTSFMHPGWRTKNIAVPITNILEQRRREVKLAEEALKNESAPALLPFWKWKLSCAESSLDHERQIAEEREW